MSQVHHDAVVPAMDTLGTSPPPATGRPLHRLRSVRVREGVSRRSLAERMRIDVPTVIHQEKEATDLTLRVLYQWQEALGVPIADLLAEQDEELSIPSLRPRQMARLMKTARSILKQTNEVRIRRVAQNLVNLFSEIIPQLGPGRMADSTAERSSERNR